MFVQPAKWEMTTGEQGKAEEGDTFRGWRLRWRLFASSLSHGCATAWTSSDRRADAAASPCPGKPGSISPTCPLLLSRCPASRLNPQQPLMSSLNWDFNPGDFYPGDFIPGEAHTSCGTVLLGNSLREGGVAGGTLEPHNTTALWGFSAGRGPGILRSCLGLSSAARCWGSWFSFHTARQFYQQGVDMRL